MFTNNFEAVNKRVPHEFLSSSAHETFEMFPVEIFLNISAGRMKGLSHLIRCFLILPLLVIQLSNVSGRACNLSQIKNPDELMKYSPQETLH